MGNNRLAEFSVLVEMQPEDTFEERVSEAGIRTDSVTDPAEAAAETITEPRRSTWLDSVPLYTLPLPPNLINRLLMDGVRSAADLLRHRGHLEHLMSKNRARQVAEVLDVLHALGSETVRKLSADAWNHSPQIPHAPSKVLWAVHSAASPQEEVLALITELTGRNQQLVLARWGYLGHPPPTFEELAREVQLTRERVRQITTGFESKLCGWRIRLPLANELIESIDMRGGIWEASVLPAEQTKVLPALERLGELGVCSEVRWEKQARAWITPQGRQVLMHYTEVLQTVLPSISRQRRRWGAFDPKLLPAAGNVPEGVRINLSLRSSENWTRDQGLVVFPQAESTLVKQVRKTLSVTGPLPIYDLHRGLEQQGRLGLLSLQEMAEILAEHVWFHLSQDERVRPTEELEAASILTAAERIAVWTIEDAEGVIDHDSYLENMESAGIGVELAGSILRQAFVVRLERAVYALRGREIEPLRIRAARGARMARFMRSLVSVDDDSSCLRLTYDLSRPCLSGSLPLPPSVRVERGKWKAVLPDGTKAMISIRTSRIQGLRPWMRRAALSPGYKLIVEVERSIRLIRIIGGY